ncbi:unnamed protein product [Tilletia laevis]|uniref:Reverse transcriptase/retrotransposon-derived protein RNase H-like domain-containing protein n=2 Tax=Tilletia TaxID=13289 RepID=A0A177TE57_9BASI|nr:hypothetical protein CF336_g8286 [Tilletia laevis]KAE8250403.1 hypothetical protein A4X03_0g6443 [Tilletia caries]CAD6936558.1 unnamed protein product [Tilletia controversa]CAD6896619.1 unnamed protein product [Tilletia laevis]CAD6923628.1 unnamed protein product [Tilletia caries]
MDALKLAAKGAPYLSVIDYTSDADIILSVDSSTIAVGYVLTQEFPKPTGRKIVLFVLEVDVLSLKYMINSPDIGNAAMIRWIPYLKTFEFSIQHIADKLHVVPDGLLRTNFNNAEAAEDDPDDHHIRPTATISFSTHELEPHESEGSSTESFNEQAYEGNLRQLGLWLDTGRTHSDLKTLSKSERKWIKTNVPKFFVERGRLFRRNIGHLPLLVLGTKKDRLKACVAVHEQQRHRGRDAMTALLLQRV